MCSLNTWKFKHICVHFGRNFSPQLPQAKVCLLCATAVEMMSIIESAITVITIVSPMYDTSFLLIEIDIIFADYSGEPLFYFFAVRRLASATNVPEASVLSAYLKLPAISIGLTGGIIVTIPVFNTII